MSKTQIHTELISDHSTVQQTVDLFSWQHVVELAMLSESATADNDEEDKAIVKI